MKALVVIPTYNESGNIKPLLKAILELNTNIEVLVVDDASPDGTADIVKDAQSDNKRVHLISRSGKKGRGLAGRDGFIYAVKKGYDYIVEMDGDFSHSPEFIPVLLQQTKEYDVIIGSREIAKSRIERKSLLRNLLSMLAHSYIRSMLNIKIKDCTSGFRCFRRDALDSIGLDTIISAGPSIVEEVLYLCIKKGYKIKEVPVVFRERKSGKSKLNFITLVDTFFMIPRIRLRHR